jgi:hypothetical protein
MTEPLYRDVSARVSQWWSYLTSEVTNAAAKAPKALPTIGASTEQCEPAPKQQAQKATPTSADCPAECSDKCVIEKRPGEKKGRTRCLRAPLCPASTG